MTLTKQSYTVDIQLDLTNNPVINELKQHLDAPLIRNERFINGIFCPHCYKKTRKFISNYTLYGFVNGTSWQRYCCKQCNRIFSDLTNTLFHRSRNVVKWREFIQLLIVKQLSIREIAKELKIHPNTAYAWNKKIMSFANLLLINVNKSRKGNHSKKTIEPPNCSSDSHLDTIPIFVAVVREAPNRVITNILRNPDYLSNDATSPSTSNVSHLTANDFLEYYGKKRGVSTSYLPIYLSWFRMIQLLKVINPLIVADEMFKQCLDKDRLSDSNRLIKQLI